VRSVLARVTLTDKERFVLERRLLVEDGSEVSLAEIGRELGVSREWARRLELRVKDKLREELRSVMAA
jgi:RNA polymerase sigma-32 factor